MLMRKHVSVEVLTGLAVSTGLEDGEMSLVGAAFLSLITRDADYLFLGNSDIISFEHI